MDYNWYALYTFPRSEKKVLARLQESEIEVFLPLYRKLRKWKDRKKYVEEPLISSYIFVKVSEREYYKVLEVEGIVRYVTFSGKAAPIPEKQIDAMKIIVESKLPVILTSEKLHPGCKIRVISGVFTGIEAEMVTFRGKKNLIIRIDQVGQSILVNIPNEAVETIIEEEK
jgi:transcription antitermination factor NusG